MTVPRWLRVQCRIAFAAACLLCAPTLPAQDPKAPGAASPVSTEYQEYQVKAAYLTDLGRYVEQWASRPKPSPDEPFEICVLGRDPFGAALDAAVRGEKVDGAPLTARRIARAQDAQSCRVLFVSSSEESQLKAVLAAVGTSPVLTVADIPDFAKKGGMIQFVLDGNHVRFEINIAASGRAGLKLSSSLLKVARAVRRAP
jgi:hypothetical protein